MPPSSESLAGSAQSQDAGPGGLPGHADERLAADPQGGPVLPGQPEQRLIMTAVAAIARHNAPGATASVGTWLRAQRQARGWNVPETARRLRKAATSTADTLPANGVLEAHIRRWERCVIAPSERYKLLYCLAFGITPGQYGQVQPPPPPALDGPAPSRPPAHIPALAQKTPQAAALCPALLSRLIAKALTAGAACHCGNHTSPVADHVDTESTIRLLITQAAYTRGADVAAIARVVGMSATEVRGVLRTVETGAWT
jgi:hypothetical protein